MGRGLSVRGVVEGDSEPHTFLPRLVALARSGDVVKPVLVTGSYAVAPATSPGARGEHP
jgi:Zn-dependent alcohol dehydrogenase